MANGNCSATVAIANPNAAIAAMILGLAETFGYPTALGISALVLMATAGILLAALLLV